MKNMHPIENILKTTMSELREIVDVNTIVGNAFVTPGGCTIIPISRVGMGFVTGGGEYGDCHQVRGEMDSQADFPFAGGSASGITISPVAFLVAEGENIKLLTVDHRNTLDKLMENIPALMTEVKELCKKRGCTYDEFEKCD